LYNGREQCTPCKANGPHVCDCYLFHLIAAGKGTLHLNNRSYSLGAGQGFLIQPGQLFQYTADKEQPWEYLWFGFGGADVSALLYNSRLLHVNPIYESPDWQTLARYMNESLAAVADGGASASIFCHGMLCMLLAHLVQETPMFATPQDVAQFSSVQMRYMRDAVSYIRKNLSSSFTASDVSDALGLNRCYFSRLFTRLCGVSPSRFIANYRLDTAWHILRHSDTQIAEIAQSVGFQDAAYFTRRFQARYDVTPSKVRAEGNRMNAQSAQAKNPSV
jgi:AraC-like DNA-binding protein